MTKPNVRVPCESEILPNWLGCGHNLHDTWEDHTDYRNEGRLRWA